MGSWQQNVMWSVLMPKSGPLPTDSASICRYEVIRSVSTGCPLMLCMDELSVAPAVAQWWWKHTRFSLLSETQWKKWDPDRQQWVSNRNVSMWFHTTQHGHMLDTQAKNKGVWWWLSAIGGLRLILNVLVVLSKSSGGEATFELQKVADTSYLDQNYFIKVVQLITFCISNKCF